MFCCSMVQDMREKEVEKKLVQAVKQRGGICPKWVSPGFDGMPDRMVLLPKGKIGFVEVKAPGEKPRPLQKARHGMLQRLGFQKRRKYTQKNRNPFLDFLS